MSADDLLTSQKNHVVATNALNQTWLSMLRSQRGGKTSACVTSPAIVAIGSGVLVSISVVEPGTAAGFIYDDDSTSGLNDASRIAAAKKEEGVYQAGIRFKNGLVVAPGEGQAITLTYSLD